MIASLAALGAAFCWAAGGLIAVAPVRALGPLAFNRLRMTVVGLMLAAAATALGRWGGLDAGQVAVLAVSGVVGWFWGTPPCSGRWPALVRGATPFCSPPTRR